MPTASGSKPAHQAKEMSPEDMEKFAGRLKNNQELMEPAKLDELKKSMKSIDTPKERIIKVGRGVEIGIVSAWMTDEMFAWFQQILDEAKLTLNATNQPNEPYVVVRTKDVD